VHAALVDPELHGKDVSLVEASEDGLVVFAAVVTPAELPRQRRRRLRSPVFDEVERLHHLHPAAGTADR
jgi:hypothetical protein